MLEEPADELQGEILEGQRRAVEELQQPLVGVELDERADGRVAEARVGLGAQPLQQGGLQLVARERPDDARGDARIAAPGARARQRGPVLGHVQAAVAREAGEQRVAEAERRRAAAGRDVAHGPDGRGTRSRDLPGRELARRMLGLDAQQPVPLGRALGALRRADLDLPAAPADGEIGEPGVLGVARARRDDRRVALALCELERCARARERARLVRLDEHRVRDARRDAVRERSGEVAKRSSPSSWTSCRAAR